MTIGLFSPISTFDLKEFLFEEDRIAASLLSADSAPAVTTLALEWLRAGHNLKIYTLDAKATERLTLNGSNLTIHLGPWRSKTKMGRILAPFGRDYRLLKQMAKDYNENFDVVSAHWTGDFALIAGRWIGKCPVFVTVRDIMPYIIKQVHGIKGYPWYAQYVKNELVMRRKGYKFVANSEYTAASIKHFWNKDVPVIPNPINEDFLNLDSQTSDKNHEEFSIATISISLIDDRRKNILTLLHALKIIRKSYPGCTLSLIGKCFTREFPLIRQLESEGLLEGVKLMGALPHIEVLKYLQIVDLMVHPSLEETFGNTLIEAMAVGCPVLGGQNSGAVPYVLESGKAGYLCDVSSAEEIAATIEQIIRNPEKRKLIAQYAKKRCQREYSSKKIADKYIELFQTLKSRL